MNIKEIRRAIMITLGGTLIGNITFYFWIIIE